MSFTLVTNSSPMPGPMIFSNTRANDCQVPSKEGGMQSGGDHPCLQQAKIVVAEIEQFAQIGEILGDLQVDAGETQKRFWNHADVSLR